MITAGRCSGGGGGGGSGGVGRTAIVSKDCRTVNGGGSGVGGYVNHCEQALDAKNEMVMAASKIAVATGGDKNTSVITATTVNNRVLPLSGSELDGLKDYTLTNIGLIENLNKLLTEKNEKMVELTNENIYLKDKLDEAHQRIAELEARNESLDVLPFTPVSSTCSSGMGDLSSAELPEQQEVKPKKRRSRQVVIKQPNPGPIENNQTKKQRTRSNRAKSADLGKMQEVSLITSNNAYYTCLGNYDPTKDDPEKPQVSSKKGILEEDLKNLEIPSWRIKTYSSWYSMEGTENMSDDIFENRHSRLEVWERKRKRWDMQRIRELRRIEYLKEGRNKHHSQNPKENEKEELTTLLPDPAHIKAIEITENLPVSAFGCNLHIKKKPESFKFFRSQWYNDGSWLEEVSQEKNVRGLRSSARGQLNDST